MKPVEHRVHVEMLEHLLQLPLIVLHAAQTKVVPDPELA